MSLFGLDRVSPHDKNAALLATVRDNVQLAVVRSLLEGAEIPYMIKERGSGSSVKIIAGFSMFGTDIFVPIDRLEEATALITPADTDGYADNGETESGEQSGDDSGAGQSDKT